MKTKNWILLAGPLVFLAILLFKSSGMVGSGFVMISILAWMLLWWSSRVVPIGITSLLPIVLFPLLDIEGLKATAQNYASPVIFLFFGGFVLGIAIEKWGLHKRISLNIIRISGFTPRRIILGSMIASAFLSMWISNTATTLMMLPIGLSIIALLERNKGSNGLERNFSAALLLGIAYAANIGGMATVIGTPPNLVLVAMAEERLGLSVEFSDWVLFAFPLVLILFLLVFFVLTYILFPTRRSSISGVSDLLRSEIKKLKSFDVPEKRVTIIFFLTAMLWIFRGLINQISFFENLSDPMIAVGGAIMLFILPDGQSGGTLMKWRDAQRIPWEILLLFGGGLAIAMGMSNTRVMIAIGNIIGEHQEYGMLGMVFLATMASVFLTEVMSNVALVSVFIPISIGISQSLGMPGLTLAIPITLGASCAFMFPISTPPNAIVYSSKKLGMTEMVKAGIILNLLSIMIISFYYLSQGKAFLE